jgi:VIT1/CCC1 family predicted Fe2+/Mn2+ transporter
MTDSTASNETWTYGAREAVGLFASADAVDAAVDALEAAGFDRAAVSVLASDAKIKDRIGRLYSKASDAEDDPKAPQAAYVSNAERREGEAAAIGIPVYIGGALGAFAMVASGGMLAGAIAAALAGGVLAGGVGALLARAIGKGFQDRAAAQLANGGIVLWVSVRDDATEKTALDVLAKAGAKDVHVHSIQREWTLKDIPFATAQPDPLLGH